MATKNEIRFNRLIIYSPKIVKIRIKYKLSIRKNPNDAVFSRTSVHNFFNEFRNMRAFESFNYCHVNETWTSDLKITKLSLLIKPIMQLTFLNIPN